MIRPCSLALAAALLSAPAQAELRANFIEGAPKDRFVFENAGDCAIENASIEVNLATSPAGLIFDTTGSGAGVEVFQPFEVVQGADVLTDTPSVQDGDTVIRLAVSSLAPGSGVAFTIDVDDTTSNRQITVNGSEIAGAQVILKEGGLASTAEFSKDASATVRTSDC